MVAEVVGALAWAPPVDTDMSCVEGVHPEGTPAQVSRTKALMTPALPGLTRFVADDKKTT